MDYLVICMLALIFAQNMKNKKRLADLTKLIEGEKSEEKIYNVREADGSAQ